MPQFDIFSFSSQVTWTLLLFTLVFAFIDYLILPIIASTLKTRSTKSFFQTLDDSSLGGSNSVAKNLFSSSHLLLSSLDIKQVWLNDSWFTTFNVKITKTAKESSIVESSSSKIILKQKINNLVCLFK